MSRLLRYMLHPRGAFHFGERGIGVEETADLLHSDTLFAALVSAWRALGGEQTADGDLIMLAPFHSMSPPLRISSAFPCVGELPLFPRPFLQLGGEKSLKQINYVSPQALAQLCQGGQLSRERAEQELLQGGQVWALPEEQQQIVSTILAGEPDDKRRDQLANRFAQEPSSITLWWGNDAPPDPHVVVDRITSSPNLYYAGRLRFAHGCSLTFWAVADDDHYLQQLDAALTFLQEEGLGGKRTSGHGQFTWTAREEPLPVADEPNCYLLLSLFHPTAEEISAGVLEGGQYRRILRRGWIFSPEGRNLRRRGLWMLREGSLLRQPPLGSLNDVKPEIGFAHPIWRYGYAFALPLWMEGFDAGNTVADKA